MRFGTFHLFPWHQGKTPEQVFQETIEQICPFTFGGWDQRKILRSMETFARDVMPHFQKAPVQA